MIIENTKNRPLFGNHTNDHIPKITRAELNKKILLREQYRIHNEELNSSLKKKEEEERIKQRLIRINILKEKHRGKYQASKLKREEVNTLSQSAILSNEKPLYVRYKEKYENEVIPLLKEEYNRKLEAIRMEHKRCPKEVLDAHSKLYKQLTNQRKLLWIEKTKKQKELCNMRQIIHSPVFDRPKQIINLYKQQALSISKKELRDRAKNYSFCVQEVLSVVPSKEKIIELKEKISKLKHYPRSKRNTRNDYLDLSKIFHAKSANRLYLDNSNLGVFLEHTSQKSINRANIRILDYAYNKPLECIPKIPIKSFSKSARGLEESAVKNKKLHGRLEQFFIESPDERYAQRTRRSHAAKRVRPQICNSWRHDITNSKLNLREKYDLITNKTKMMEDIIKRDEKLLISNSNIDLECKVNYMLVDTIKAKLSLFQQLNQ